MNKFIKKELEKIRAECTSYDDNTTVIHFYKSRTGAPVSDQEFVVGTKYRISIEDYIIHEPENFTLSTNWNKGVKPVSKILEGTLIRIQGNMLQWNLVGFDDVNQVEKEDRYNELWLPRKSITVLGQYRFV